MLNCIQVIDEPQLLAEKCKHLAKIIDESQHIVIYTGAGISTVIYINITQLFIF